MRIIDIMASALGLAVLSPLLVLVALAVKLSSSGPVLHKAVRAGKSARPFFLYKFRTMVAGADRVGPGITLANDSRVTRVGRLLRKTKMDELPQLINVLWGEMALVGPRPEDPRYVARYTDEQRRALSVRPGITSPASLAFRDEASLLTGSDWEEKYIAEIMPRKLAIEIDYLTRRTVWTDLAVITRTVAALALPDMVWHPNAGDEPEGAPLNGRSS